MTENIKLLLGVMRNLQKVKLWNCLSIEHKG